MELLNEDTFTPCARLLFVVYTMRLPEGYSNDTRD